MWSLLGVSHMQGTLDVQLGMKRCFMVQADSAQLLRICQLFGLAC
jgi:hypothetical protein